LGRFVLKDCQQRPRLDATGITVTGWTIVPHLDALTDRQRLDALNYQWL
jgi:hypothetical protein